LAVPNLATQDFVTLDLTDEGGTPDRWIPASKGAHLYQRSSPPGAVDVTISASLAQSQPALFAFASGCDIDSLDQLVAMEGQWCPEAQP
jgi:hypothetical protein